MHAAVDPVSGRVFVANSGTGRGSGDISITVLELNGRSSTLPASSGPGHIAVSASHRRAIAIHPSGNYATLIDTDTLETRSVMTGINPSRAIVVEGTGLAYVLAKGPASGTGSGSITEIDLRSSIARTFPLPGFGPENAVANASGTRLFVIGTSYRRTGEWMPGFVQAFDTLARLVEGVPIPLGRMPRHVLAGAEEVYVIGHVDFFRGDLPPDDMRRNSIRPALFVLDAATLAVKRTIALPDTTSLDRLGPLFTGRTALDAAANIMYVLDSYNERLSIVNPASAEVRSMNLEAPGLALAVNPVARSVLVSFNSAGYLGIFSMDGERLDTVPIGRAPNPGELMGLYDIAVDASTGNAYVTNGHASSISILRRPASSAEPAVVNLTDLWFNPSQPGWGVFLDQQGATLFATLFTHDPAGNPSWLFMSNGKRQPDGSFAGDLYRTRGPIADALRNVSAVGTMRFEPGAGEAATLTWFADGGLHTRVVQRFRFNDATRDCKWGVDSRKAVSERSNFTALWSNPADPGWGLAISHQGDTVFGVLFTYDEQNRASWVVMSNGERLSAATFGGEVYRAAGGKIELAGNMSLAFTSGDNGVLRYRLGGLDFQGPILRQTFSRLTTHCSS